MPELQPTFDLLKELSASMQSGSCLPLEPFMKLGTGQAPTLNYLMPQKSGFKAYGNFVLTLADSIFEASVKENDSSGFYAKIKNMKRYQLEAILREELLGKKMNTKLIPSKFALIAKNNLKTTKGEVLRAGEEAMMKSMNTGSSGPVIEEPVVCDIPFSQVVDSVLEGNLPIPHYGLNGVTGIDFVAEPTTPKPTLFVIEEYSIASYIGDYGAGKALKTMSLLPGEKTTITIRIIVR